MQTNSTTPINTKPIVIWLLVGVGMLVIQIVLGGITRLTGSGLSITEWDPIMGFIPPLNEQQWLQAFNKYKQIPQYQYINAHFTLNDFKFIFFWEWLHRLWARLIGVVFIVPFIWFLYKKKFNQTMIKPLLILFLLGGLQGLVGWIMVASGLQDLVYVSHIRLAIHFVLALGLLCYTAWFAFKLFVPNEHRIANTSLRKCTFVVLITLIIQLIYGAFMAGLKAASVATTWPTINGEWVPSNLTSYGNNNYSGLSIVTNNPIAVQFIHRTIAYVLIILIAFWSYKAYKIKNAILLQKMFLYPLFITVIQMELGILTVLNAADGKALLYLGVAHQCMAMILLLMLVWMMYIVRSNKINK